MAAAVARAVAVARVVVLAAVSGGSRSGKVGRNDDGGSSDGSTGGSFGW